MEIPTDADGQFEVVTDDDEIVGAGTVVDGQVTFTYAGHAAGGPHTHHLSEEAFADAIAAHPAFDSLTIRAAA